MFKLVLVSATLVAATTSVHADATNPDERECPTEVKGVRISAMPIRDGVAFKFSVAKATQLPGLRALLREAAAIIEHQTRVAALHPEMMPLADGEGAVTALDISVKDTPSGAMVTVRPDDKVFVSTMQRNAHQFEKFWSAHECVSTSMVARIPTQKVTTR